MKTLLLDIETRPYLIYSWRTWDTEAIEVVEEWGILSFSVKWLDDPPSGQVTKGLCDYRGNRERKLLEDLRKFLNEADIVVGHNLDEYDVKRINSKFLEHGIPPPSPYRTVDTYKVAKSRYYMTSNKLEYLAKLLGVGSKVKHQGFDLWKGCMKDDEYSWKMMLYYNANDVFPLLQGVYLAELPWIKNHPNVATLFTGCTKCGSTDVQRRGFQLSNTSKYQRYRCNSCGGWSRSRKAEKQKFDLVGL